jgi:hypothetical protein
MSSCLGKRSSPVAATIVHVVAPIFVLSRLRRKRTSGENVCNALPGDADAGKLCDHVPVNGTVRAESTNNDKRTTWLTAA